MYNVRHESIYGECEAADIRITLTMSWTEWMKNRYYTHHGLPLDFLVTILLKIKLIFTFHIFLGYLNQGTINLHPES